MCTIIYYLLLDILNKIIEKLFFIKIFVKSFIYRLKLQKKNENQKIILIYL